MGDIEKLNNYFYTAVKELLHNARNKVYQTINSTMTQTYWEIGRRIVKEEQSGEDRAEYGKSLLKALSYQLTQEFGRGLSVDNLEKMRKFYLVYPNSETVSRKFKLSWSHYIFLTRISNENERNFYEIESIEGHWSLRELRRQFDEDENPTIGIILCKDKSKTLVEMTLPKDNAQIYASKYLTVLPNKEEFRRLLEDE